MKFDKDYKYYPVKEGDKIYLNASDGYITVVKIISDKDWYFKIDKNRTAYSNIYHSKWRLSDLMNNFTSFTFHDLGKRI